jgi:predicted ATPase
MAGRSKAHEDTRPGPPYLVGLQLRPERIKSDGFPFDLPAVRTLDLKFESPVTLFVGENGTGSRP